MPLLRLPCLFHVAIFKDANSILRPKTQIQKWIFNSPLEQYALPAGWPAHETWSASQTKPDKMGHRSKWTDEANKVFCLIINCNVLSTKAISRLKVSMPSQVHYICFKASFLGGFILPKFMDQTLFDPCVVQNPVPRDKPAIFNYLVSVYLFPNWSFLAIFKKTELALLTKLSKKF